MNISVSRRRWALPFAALAIAIVASAAPSLAQERFGALKGTLKDDTGAVLPGVTVSITNKETGKVYTVVSGNDGGYRLLDLEPGRYNVRFELPGFSAAESPDVNLLLGKTLDVSPVMAVGGVNEAITVSGDSPLIDARSTTIAHNVTAEEFERIPKGRSFQNLAISSPSVNAGEIEGGIQVNGASGSENSFTIDGVVTNSIVNGAARQDAVFEYLQEVQVKTGGISAEYGGALGGVISAVTKSGGNTFHGEGHYYFSGSPLSAAPVKRLVLDPRDDITVNYYQDEKQDDFRNEIGGSIGGPILKNKLFFFGSFAPRYVNRTNEYHFNNGAEQGSIDRKQTFMSAFGKISYDPSSRIRTAVSVLATPTKSTGFTPAYDGTGANVRADTLQANEPNKTRGFEQPQYSYAGTADITLTSSSLLSVRGGFFDDNYMDTGIPLTNPVEYGTSNIGLPYPIPLTNPVEYGTSNIGLNYPIPADLRGGVAFRNTPRVQINKFDHTQRGYVNFDYIQAINFGGQHSLKGGFGVQHTTNDVDLSYPAGGYVTVWWDRAFESSITGRTERGQYGYYQVDDIGTRGKVNSDILSLYVQDQWTLNNRLTLNLGLRTERETIPSFRPEIQNVAFRFGFKDKLSPRLGASYDWFGDGRLKVYGSWGRYMDWTKYELARGGFGGDIWFAHYRSLDTLDVFSLSGENMPGRNLWSDEPGSRQDLRVPNFDTVDPDLKPMSQDAFNVGTEYQINQNTVFTANFVHNNLRRTIEDLGVLENGDEIYKYVNPGEGIARTMNPSGLTAVFETPKPRRQYDALELTLTRRVSKNWFGSASYVLSRLYGNYAGLSNSDEISTPTTGRTSATAQQEAGSIARPGSSANRAWDLDELVWDSHGNLDVLGRLATDRPHAVKLYGSYLLPTGTQVGAFFYGASGTPVSRMVQSVNRIPIFVDGRGSLGRTPFLSQTDLLVSHELKMVADKKVRLELNVLNVFNQKTPRHIFDTVNRPRRRSSGMNLQRTDLAQGYDYNALLDASPDGANARDPRYLMDDLFNPGLQARVSAKFIF